MESKQSTAKKATGHKKGPGARKPPPKPSFPPLLPSLTGGLDLGREYPLEKFLHDQREKYFQGAELRQASRKFTYDTDWGDALVDQALADDPPPINGGSFHPAKRWIVVYRTAEAGLDGTHNVTVNDIRTAISGISATNNPFIIKKLHIWIAPNTVNTHFSGLLITADDEVNGIVGGQYSDIAPYGEYVKFRVVFRGEGYVAGTTTSGTKLIFQLGGSAKWNGLVYAQVETYN